MTEPLRARSPSDRGHSPYGRSETDDDISELFDRTRDLEDAGKSARDARYDLGARISALEDVSAPVPSNAITTAELSTAVAQRFDEVTADRDILNGELTIQAQTQAATTADLRHENHLLRGELAAIRAAITRLELRGPAPLRQRSRSRSPHLSTRDHKKEPNSVRPHSPVPDLPAKRQRTAQGEGFLRLGPLPQSDLLPLAYFDTLIKRVLPTFVVTGQYSTSMDPEHAYHLRVTLDSVSQMAALKKAWDVAPRPFEFQDVRGPTACVVKLATSSVIPSGSLIDAVPITVLYLYRELLNTLVSVLTFGSHISVFFSCGPSSEVEHAADSRTRCYWNWWIPGTLSPSGEEGPSSRTFVHHEHSWSGAHEVTTGGPAYRKVGQFPTSVLYARPPGMDKHPFKAFPCISYNHAGLRRPPNSTCRLIAALPLPIDFVFSRYPFRDSKNGTRSPVIGDGIEKASSRKDSPGRRTIVLPHKVQSWNRWGINVFGDGPRRSHAEDTQLIVSVRLYSIRSVCAMQCRSAVQLHSVTCQCIAMH
ncbi:hypothetical protein DFH06DRAFT_1125029 [Mycena polygramma]|nr:hypothetical protein DFH06DRAFT_1125029 [Mycena polygramma]